MHDRRQLSADVHCQDLMELEEVVGRGRLTSRRMTWAGRLAKVWREKASEQIEVSVFALEAQAQILMSIQRTAVGDLHPAEYCFP